MCNKCHNSGIVRKAGWTEEYCDCEAGDIAIVRAVEQMSLEEYEAYSGLRDSDEEIAQQTFYTDSGERIAIWI